MVAGIMTCILIALLHGILVYGADKRNRSAILIWIILQIIGLVAFSMLGLGFIFALRSVEDLGFLRNWKFYFILILIFVGVISFPIWTVLVAIRVIYLVGIDKKTVRKDSHSIKGHTIGIQNHHSLKSYQLGHFTLLFFLLLTCLGTL